VIRQNLHDFASAEADLNAILAIDPQNGEARLTRAFVRQTIGALDAAKEDCRKLPSSVGLLEAAICLARVEAATGSSAKALERLTGALGADEALAAEAKAKPETRRWAQALAADAASSLGLTEEANRRFSAAAANSDDVPTLVAYADYLLDAGRPAEALTLLADRSDADAVLLRLAIAGKAVGDPRAPRWASVLGERFAADRANKVAIHQREEARFELEVKGDPATALALAEANWKTQKEIADARLVLQAALAAKDRAAAADVLGFIKATGLNDIRIKSLQDQIAENR
jgi:tetratricopeptide (TPR) repeat protein